VREIKFRAWDKIINEWVYFTLEELCNEVGDFSIMKNWCQYTGLKDKKTLTEIYEYDILDVNGNIIGNMFENKELLDETEKDLKDPTNLIIQRLGTSAWCTTHYAAISRGCTDSE